jgi:hypothetical protein
MEEQEETKPEFLSRHPPLMAEDQSQALYISY